MNIYWPVFSSLDRFVLKIEHGFFTMGDIGIVSGNMLRARKYRFALCFRVLSAQCVQRSAYANFFKFHRENKRFERPQSKQQMFPLISGRHVGVPQTGSNMASPY